MPLDDVDVDVVECMDVDGVCIILILIAYANGV